MSADELFPNAATAFEEEKTSPAATQTANNTEEAMQNEQPAQTETTMSTEPEKGEGKQEAVSETEQTPAEAPLPKQDNETGTVSPDKTEAKDNVQEPEPANEQEQEQKAAEPEKPARKTRARRSPAKEQDEQRSTEQTPISPESGSEEEKLPTGIFYQLQYIQQHLKVGKGNMNHQTNASTMKDDSFPYRTLEEIYQELKPLLAKLNCILISPWKPIILGNSIFAEATVTLMNANGEKVESTASAMLNLDSKTYKYPAQETLACGTMAIKSALGGMFLLDNTTKDRQLNMVTAGMDGMVQPGHVPASAPVSVSVPATAPAPVQPPASAPAPAPVNVNVNVTPAPAPESDINFEKEKPLLRKGTIKYQTLGINVINKYRNTKEHLKDVLRDKFVISDEDLEAFVSEYWRDKSSESI